LFTKTINAMARPRRISSAPMRVDWYDGARPIAGREWTAVGTTRKYPLAPVARPSGPARVVAVKWNNAVGFPDNGAGANPIRFQGRHP
jgi:hypothetical protein